MLRVLPAKKQGFYLEWQGRALSSKIDPVLESERLNIQRKTQTYVLALGLHPVYHLLKLIDTVKKFYIIDPRLNKNREWIAELLRPFAQKEKIREFMGKSVFRINLHGFDFFNTIKSEEVLLVDTLKSEGGLLREHAQSLLHRCLQQEKTENYFNRLWFKNSFANLKNFKHRWVSSLSGSAFKKPVFLSSGPSLAQTLSALEDKKHERRELLIVAVAGIVPILRRRGWEPDFILSTDASYTNSMHFWRIAKPHPPLIASLSIHPSICRLWTNNIYFFVDDTNLLEASPSVRAVFFPMQGTVSSAAIYLFKYLGYPSFYAGGLDFSMTSFSAHCRGNTTEEILFSRNTRMQPAETRMHYLFHFFAKKTSNSLGWTDEKMRTYAHIASDLCRTLSMKIDKKKITRPAHIPVRRTEPDTQMPYLLSAFVKKKLDI